MPGTIQLLEIASDQDLRHHGEPLRAYAATLPAGPQTTVLRELDGLPAHYRVPHGRLLVVMKDQQRSVGCVAVRSAEERGVCEMKRLFVMPEARRLGAGTLLASGAIEAAHSLGYRMIKLGTFPKMITARNLYFKLGFVPGSPSNRDKSSGLIWLELQIN